jgi:hypothetical protein
MRPRHRLTRCLSIAMLTVMVAAGLPAAVVAQASAAPAGGSLATPEDAVRAYLAGVAAGDVDAILAASAVDAMSSGFRTDAYVDRLRMYDFLNAPAPAEHPFFVETNRVRLAARIMGQVQMLAYSLLTDETLDGPPIVITDQTWAEAFVAAADPARLADLTVLDVAFPAPDLEQDQGLLDAMARSAAVYGADEQTERLATLAFEGGMYELGFTLLRYGDSWRVSSQTSPLAGTSAFGTARRVEP